MSFFEITQIIKQKFNIMLLIFGVFRFLLSRQFFSGGVGGEGQNRIYRFPLNSILPLCLWSSTKMKVKLKVFWNFYMIGRDQSQVSLHTPRGIINLGQIFLGNQLLNISHLHHH